MWVSLYLLFTIPVFVLLKMCGTSPSLKTHMASHLFLTSPLTHLTPHSPHPSPTSPLTHLISHSPYPSPLTQNKHGTSFLTHLTLTHLIPLPPHHLLTSPSLISPLTHLISHSPHSQLTHTLMTHFTPLLTSSPTSPLTHVIPHPPHPSLTSPLTQLTPHPPHPSLIHMLLHRVNLPLSVLHVQ